MDENAVFDRGKFTEFKQSGGLPVTKKMPSRGHSSDDPTHFFIAPPDQAPGTEEQLSYPYNCWSWATNPATGHLLWADPPGFQDVHDVFELAEITRRFLGSKGWSCSENYSNSDIDDVIRQINQDNPDVFVIAMRVQDPDPAPGAVARGKILDYHFARYYFGQWTQKAGAKGRLLLLEPTAGTLRAPDSLWEEHVKEPPNPTLVTRPRNSESHNRPIQRTIYNSSTVYLVARRGQ
jgi:hypothetical protein